MAHQAAQSKGLTRSITQAGSAAQLHEGHHLLLLAAPRHCATQDIMVVLLNCTRGNLRWQSEVYGTFKVLLSCKRDARCCCMQDRLLHMAVGQAAPSAQLHTGYTILWQAQTRWRTRTRFI